jgi:hypothetical protein
MPRFGRNASDAVDSTRCHEHPHAPLFVVAGPQQRDFSAGAQQAVRCSALQQADSETVSSSGAGETGVPVVGAMLPPLSGGGRIVRDEFVDMDEPRSRLGGSTVDTVSIAAPGRETGTPAKGRRSSQHRSQQA